MSKWRWEISGLGLFILLLNACSFNATDGLPYYKDASFTPYWYAADDLPQDFHQIPAFSLTNQLGEDVTERQMDDKISVVDFFFTTCPGICPKMTTNMSLLQEAYSDDDEVLLFSHSAMPTVDNVEVLKAYADLKEIEASKWHLLTGDKRQIYDLGRNAYFVEEDLGVDKDLNDFLHTENFVLIDQKRRIRGIYNGLSLSDIEQLKADIQSLKEES